MQDGDDDISGSLRQDGFTELLGQRTLLLFPIFRGDGDRLAKLYLVCGRWSTVMEVLQAPGPHGRSAIALNFCRHPLSAFDRPTRPASQTVRGEHAGTMARPVIGRSLDDTDGPSRTAF